MRRLTALVLGACSGALALWPAGGAARPDLQARIDAAAPGETVTVSPGTYRGPVVIDKPLRLIGHGRPVIDAAGRGTVITVKAPDVTVRGLVARNSGTTLVDTDAGIVLTGAPRARVVDNRFEDVLFGIHLLDSPDSRVTGNVIGAKRLPVARRGDGLRIWGSDGALVERNTVRHGRDAVIWYSRDVTTRDNEVSDSRYGLHLMYVEDSTIDDNRFVHNSVGVYAMYSRRLTMTGNILAEGDGPSGLGLGLKDVDDFTANRNRIVGNRVGIYIDNSPSTLSARNRFAGNLVAYNEVGVQAFASVAHNVFTRNAFVDNGTQIEVDGGGTLDKNRWSAGGVGNFWSDYAGFDADGDGIGDIPERVEEPFAVLTGDNPGLNIYAGTPAARAIDFAARAFPVLEPEPKAVDRRPLTSAPTLPPMRKIPVPGSGAANLLWPVLLLAVAAGVVAASGVHRGRRRGPGPKAATATATRKANT